MMSDAYSLLTQAIEAAPQRPSCYNNRAQILRLQGSKIARWQSKERKGSNFAA